MKKALKLCNDCPLLTLFQPHYSSLHYKMHTLLLHYYFLNGNQCLIQLDIPSWPSKTIRIMFWPLFPSIMQYCFFASPPFSLHLLLSSSPLLFYTALLRTSWPQHSEKQCLEKMHGRGEHQLAALKRCKQTSLDDKNTFFPFDTFTPMTPNLFQHPQDWKKPLQHLFRPPVFAPCYHSTCFSINFKKKNKHESLD